jgi:hypothetical protein
MALATETAAEAIELEAWVTEIPDLQAHFDKLQTRLEKGAGKKQTSFMTNRGGTQRSPFWASATQNLISCACWDQSRNWLEAGVC